MALAQASRPPLTFDDYLAFADGRPEIEKWDLIDGELVMMTRASADHAQIVMNIAARLRDPMDRRGCRVLSDVLVRNREVDTYALGPDILVRCGPPGKERFITDPVLIAEVLSPSTMDYDRGLKLGLYKSFSSVLVIVLVYQTERRLEVIRRDGEGWTMDVVTDRAAALDLPEIGFSMPVASVYDGVDLPRA